MFLLISLFSIVFYLVEYSVEVTSTTYTGNIYDFEGTNAAEQLVYGTTSEGFFGGAVGAYGDRIAIGEVNGNNGKGMVSIYTHLDEDGEDVGGWYLESTLTSQYSEENDQFGCSVSMYATTVVIGASHADYNGQEDSGTAFIYEIHLNEEYRYRWKLILELTRDDYEAQDYFGSSVGIYGNTTVIGCYGCDPLGTMSGSVYVYAKYHYFDDDGNEVYMWAYHHTLTSPTAYKYEFFGISVAIYNDVIVVGATGLDDPVSRQGKTGGAYVFDTVPDDTYADGIGWKVFAELSPGNGKTNDGFGTSVAVYDGVVVIGSPYSSSGAYQSGSVYVYHKDKDDNWYFETILVPSHPTSQLHFGFSVSVYKDVLLAGSLNTTGLSTVYVFGKEYDTTNRNNIYWDLIFELQPLTEISGDKYGSAVTVFESLIVIGAPLASSPWQEQTNDEQSQDKNQKEKKKQQRLYENGAIHIYWAIDRINIEYVSPKIQVITQSVISPPKLSTGGLIIAILSGLLISGYIYFAAASYIVKLEQENSQKGTDYQEALNDSQRSDESNQRKGTNQLDISSRESIVSDVSQHRKPDQEILKESLARLSTRSTHVVYRNQQMSQRAVVG